MQGYGLFTLEEMIYSPTGTVFSRGPGSFCRLNSTQEYVSLRLQCFVFFSDQMVFQERTKFLALPIFQLNSTCLY